MCYSLDMTTRSKQVPTTALYYLAGVIDSDGCISISKMAAGKQRTSSPRYVLTVNVVNTSVALMEWLVGNFGGRYKCRRLASANHKATYDWWFNNSKAAELLTLVEPFLIVKGDQARHGIALLQGWVRGPLGQGAKTPPEEVHRREVYYQRMKALNQTGPVQPQRLSPWAPAPFKQDDAIV